jgi:hypothetical protein
VAVTNRGSDIIFMSDCRLGRGIEKIKRILQLGLRTSYNLYANSTRGDRGVCIAISRERNVEVLEEIRDRVSENYLLLKCKIDQRDILIGCVYGPNNNNIAFYRELIEKIEGYNLPTVIGGDFNTVLCELRGAENLDLEDREHVPQRENGRILREWIERGKYCEPFRRKYPMAQTMSYIPFRTRRRVGDAWVYENYGKSRLDFYIISEGLFGEVESVFYGDRLSRDFDHLEAVLRLGKRRKAKEMVYIKNETLDRPEITEIGVLGALDCISNHLSRPSEELRLSIGRLEAIYVEKGNIRRGIELALTDDADRDNERLEQLTDEWHNIVHRIGPVDEWAAEDLSCSRSSFYEVLLNEYKNRIVGLQGGIDRDTKYMRRWLVSKVKAFTEIFGKHSEQSGQCEEDLLNYDSNRVREETGKYMSFLRANNEKPTRKFCKLGKECNTVDDIAQIEKPGGGAFKSEQERAEHVRNFYVNLYKKKIDRVLEIESMFETDEWETVQREGRRLGENIKQELEGDVTLEELKKSLDTSNMSSCPGWDGISYKCLSRLWEYIKIPMLNMARESFREGILSSTLRTGMLKLIPKGKNNTRVEDWRPISLLSTSYKIISGVVASRLEKTLPHIIGRSQKGFLKYKNMGTVLHNVIDGINESWVEGEQMGVLLVDFIKAFDSVEHEYIRKCLEHFNLGPVLIGMVMTLLNDRKASVNMGSMYSQTFDIKRGTPQGDRSSPYIFIICLEILLIKIEMGGGGQIVGRHNTDLRGEQVNSVNEAFADDLTAVFRMSNEAVKCILGTLTRFGELSGLNINMEKTHIMIVGREWEGPDTIEGIKVQKECKLLGVQIDYKGKNLQCNWNKCKTKIQGLINFWNQYNLTVIGRILVAKTFLLSQVSFLLGIIPIDNNNAKVIEEMIERYAIGKLQIARDRIYNKIEQGGTGLLRIGELDTAMKSAWVNRWKKEGAAVDITGSRVLGTARQECIEYINKDLLPNTRYPCARGIANAWHEFRSKLYENDGNFYSAGLFTNPGLRNRMGEMVGGGNVFAREKYENIRENIWDIPVGVYCLEEGIREKGEVERIMGVLLTNLEYVRLRGVIKYLRGKYKPVWELRGTGKSIAEWLLPIKKGSNKIRNLISGRGSRQYRAFNFDKIRPIGTLWQQQEVEIDEGLVTCSMTVWCVKEVDTEYRQFAFRWYQGMIHGNTVISHFGDVDRKCTFCKIIETGRQKQLLGRDLTQAEVEGLNVTDEDRPHIFWNCEVVNRCIQDVYGRFWGGNRQVEKKQFLLGIDTGIVEANVLYMMVNMYIKQRIWKYKLAGVLPISQNISNELEEWVNKLTCHIKWRNMLPLVRQHVHR